MEQAKDIGDILNPSESPQPSVSKEPAASDLKPDGKQPRDEKGKFASQQPASASPAAAQPGEKPSEPTPPVGQPKNDQPPPGYVPVSALIDLRVDARQAKQERDDLRQRLADLQRPKSEPVDFWTEPDAALKQRLDPLQNEIRQTISSMTLRASKAEAIATHGRPAVDAMEAEIGKLIEANDPELPALRQAMLSSEDPVGIAMNWYSRRKVLAEVGNDLAAYRKRIEDEIRAEIAGGASPSAQPGQPTAAEPPVLPSNLAGARNVGTRAGPAWSGPAPLKDIFKR
jgi:hypothetical protein